LLIADSFTAVCRYIVNVISVVKRLTPGPYIGLDFGRAGNEQFIQSDLTRKAISLTIL
jgi:hypothetical protein